MKPGMILWPLDIKEAPDLVNLALLIERADPGSDCRRYQCHGRGASGFFVYLYVDRCNVANRRLSLQRM